MRCLDNEPFSIWIIDCYLKKGYIDYITILFYLTLQEIFSAVENDFWQAV